MSARVRIASLPKRNLVRNEEICVAGIDWRECRSPVYLEVKARVFLLPWFTANAMVEKFSGGTIITDEVTKKFSMLYTDGSYYTYDFELSEKLITTAGEFLFYSESGVSLFSADGSFEASFNDYNQYFTDFDFSEIESRVIKFSSSAGDWNSKTLEEIKNDIGRIMFPTSADHQIVKRDEFKGQIHIYSC